MVTYIDDGIHWKVSLKLYLLKWCSGSFTDFHKLAKVCKVNIGDEELPLELWKNQFPAWVKDIPLKESIVSVLGEDSSSSSELDSDSSLD